MKKRLSVCAVIVAAAMLLSGCGEMFSKEYVSVKDFSPPEQESITKGEHVTVRNFFGLKQALLALAYSGETSGKIIFDQTYDGDFTDDMASACWQVRTQDALCAYCVEDISYDFNKIVTFAEANVYISYSLYGVKATDIVKIYYSVGLERILKEALTDGKYRLAVLVSSSSSSAEDVLASVTNIYRENPTIAPKEPKASVTMFSGDSKQRLFEINISYGFSEEEKERRLARLNELAPFDDAVNELSDAEKVFAVCEYLNENCTISLENDNNTAYAALISNSANSEGIALGFVELCRRLSLDCRIVYGQKAWEDHCWNIVKIDGSYYHIDISETMSGNYEQGLFADDARFWGNYRWDVASYPKCEGELTWKSYLELQSESVMPEDTQLQTDSAEEEISP